MGKIITGFWLPPDKNRLSEMPGARVFYLKKIDRDVLKQSTDPIARFLLKHIDKLNGRDVDIELHTRIMWRDDHHRFVSTL